MPNIDNVIPCRECGTMVGRVRTSTVVDGKQGKESWLGIDCGCWARWARANDIGIDDPRWTRL